MIKLCSDYMWFKLTSDIDECTERFAECTHQCHNTVGSYYCSCLGSRYRLQDDNATCLGKFIIACPVNFTTLNSDRNM